MVPRAVFPATGRGPMLHLAAAESRAKLLVLLVILCCSRSPGLAGAASDNLVENGSFDKDADSDGIPDGWAVSGRRDIKQQITRDAGRDDGHSARLSCTEFAGGTPDAHAMVCQVGVIGVKRGQWYRLSFWAKGRDIECSSCQVQLSKTKPWGNSGIGASFPVSPAWRHVERFCQATDDVPAEHSRLQFWYGSTGTLWLDDVVLEPVDMQVKYHPEIATAGVRNVIPNSSFECGGAGWGSYAPNLTSWSGNIYRQLGEIDETTASHGRRSLRLRLDKNDALVYHWDYFDAVVEPVHTLLAAHFGWVPLERGKPYVLSCYLKADRTRVPVQLMASQSSGGTLRHIVEADTQWKRYTFRFTARGDFGWTAVGLDLHDSYVRAATLWVDAVQLEFAEKATEYAPRSDIESFIETPAVGNVFTDPQKGMNIDVCLYNGGNTENTVQGRLAVTDFSDREVLSSEVRRKVGPGEQAHVRLENLLAGRRGFFRVHWHPEGHAPAFAQTLRCAVVDPYRHTDSPFGMNHAYPWDFMLRLCKTAGLTWMRDWSAKWHTVEPQQGYWDFKRTDPQIDRVLATGLNPLMLLPFASAPWCSGADRDVIREYTQGNRYQELRSVVACPAKDPALFRNYVARTVEHYRDRVSHYEIMNEPLYTTYAVPHRFGYDMEDYLQILKDAYTTIKANQPQAQVIGGIGTWVDQHWVQEFIAAGGLRWCDAMDIHLYPVTIPPEIYGRDLAVCWRKMQERGEAKPIWLTEVGCYADDDPYRTPNVIGDSAMSRANWPSERDASEAVVKTAAAFLSHGVTKIFYHAGTCGPINGRDGGGIFFEYGGAPRKMYVALSALANLLGPAPKPVSPAVTDDRLQAYLFDTGEGAVAIVWSSDEQSFGLPLRDQVTARDIMGNAIKQNRIDVGYTPLYLNGPSADSLRNTLREVGK